MRYSTTRESYSEVFEIINFLGDEYKDKIPEKLYKFIENNRDKKYKPNFKLTDLASLNETSISRKAIAIMVYLNVKYWLEDEEEIKRMEKIYKADQKRFEDEVLENYDEEILINAEPLMYSEEETLLPAVIKEKWYIVLWRKIINLLRRKK